MRRLLRSFWLLVHLSFSGFVVFLQALTCRDGSLVVTRHQDVDDEGLDRQAGPLVDALEVMPGARLVEVSALPPGPIYVLHLVIKGRIFISYAALLAAARCLSLGSRDPERLLRARTAVALTLFRLLRPRELYVPYPWEPARPLVRAAHRLGIRSVGIQEGDFSVGSGTGTRGSTAEAEADEPEVICAWSPWFRQRALRFRPDRRPETVRVTGRLRYPEEPAPPPSPGPVHVLLLSEADPVFHQELAPFLEVLRRSPGLEVRVKRHPDEPAPADPDAVEDSLPEALRAADVVVGARTSALLEALWWSRPVLVVRTPRLDDPAGLVGEGLATPCDRPERLPELCRTVASAAGGEDLAAAREKVWGGSPPSPLEEILRAAASP